MAAPEENLLSLGHLTGAERSRFTKQREYGVKNRPVLLQDNGSNLQSHQHLQVYSRVMHLQRHWQELKERECIAQQHNRQLLQQFEKAQGTIREMLACNAAMKTIRMEYERYLEESVPRWQRQLKKKTQATQRKRMEEHLSTFVKNTEEQMTKSSADRPLLSQGLSKKPQEVFATQESHNRNSQSDCKQDVSCHLPFTQSTWLTHTQSQTARAPVTVPYQPQGFSHVPPSYLPPPPIFPHPHQFRLHHLSSMPSHNHHHPWPIWDPPGWASPQTDNPWSWSTGAAGISSRSNTLWGQFDMDAPPCEADTSRAPNSKRERGGGSASSHLSQGLDIKPVRLSSSHAGSNESGRDSSLASSDRRNKRGRRRKTRRTSSDRESNSCQESSRTSRAIAIAEVATLQTSQSNGRCRTRSSGGLAGGSPSVEKVTNERAGSEGGDSGSHKDGNDSSSEESGSQMEESMSENSANPSPDYKSDSCREEASESDSTKTENEVAEIEKRESSSSAESSAEKNDEEEHKKDFGGDDDQRHEEQKEGDGEADDDKVSAERNKAEEEFKDQGDDTESRKQSSASSQDEEVVEDESERDDSELGEDEEGSDEGEDEEEEEQKCDEAGEPEEENDSDDSIISPEENRLKKMHDIPGEAAEDEDDDERKGSKAGSSDEDSNELSDEDDIENLLAPQEQRKKKEENHLKDDDKLKATCDKVEIFQVELDSSTQTDQQSDSDEFDHFYD